MKSKIQGLFEYYSNIYARFDLFFDKPEGALVFSELNRISELFKELQEKEVIFPGQSFLEAGSGDGRVVALASFFGFQSYGIELGENLAIESIGNISTLVQKKILYNKPKIIQGNFLEENPYKRLGKPFSEFDIIFNYHTAVKELILKVESDSKKDRILILYLIRENAYKINNFDLIFTKSLSNIFNESIFVYRRL